ncbi:PAC2 family protein [Lysinibacter sp. HNR]|uniref:proteasome assembly chaperone family protein n=1 Tax=Lysinibacter sp. HNR TaxID=3031408 RepID=UPI002434B6B5|nr:PAC2 family protein [Lysinibacter sp. HNR]WGD36172.1 PAC2 family protein [Lysinibacter sp. HNR]
MRSEEPLFELIDDAYEQIESGLPLVIALTGFADAGSAVSQLENYFINTVKPEPVVFFDADVFLDYRSRRPSILFAEDRLVDYRVPELKLYHAHDELGQPFLLLMGFEPDYMWERFVASVFYLMEDLQVSQTVWVHSIPMPVPHTRPIGVTVSGTRTDLIDSLSVWKPSAQVSATIGHLIENRLQEAGKQVVGFVLLISHYLADSEYPAALLSALECISEATGLIFPTDSIRERGREFMAKIAEQVASNPETQNMVTQLEERHDSYMQGTTVRSPLIRTDGTLPSADQIASELERFLAAQQDDEGFSGPGNLGDNGDKDKRGDKDKG